MSPHPGRARSLRRYILAFAFAVTSACKPPPDTTAPDTTLLVTPSSPSASAEATFAFGGSDDGAVAGFECALDAAVFSACTSPLHLTGLGAGTHTFSVRAVDAANNADESPAQHTWIIDLTAPMVTFGARPPVVDNATATQFTFSSPDADVQGFECQLDAAPATSCTSPHDLGGLGAGVHTLTVTARDAAGNAASASYTWSIDLDPPDVSIDLGPTEAAATRSATAAFTFSSTAPDLDRFECALDGGGVASCAANVSFGPLGEGTHSLSVVAVDVAGNRSSPAVRTWTVDTTGPAVSLDLQPNALTNDPNPSLAFSSAASDLAAFECNINGAGFSPCTSPLSPLTAEGANSVAVRASDVLGNQGPEVVAAWIQDTVAPYGFLSASPPSGTSATGADFSFGCSETCTFQCSLDGGPYADCSTGLHLSGLGTGLHTLRALATDAAGNDSPRRIKHRWLVTGGPWAGVDVGRHACAIVAADRSLRCWGRNDNSELGLGYGGLGAESFAPQAVANIADVAQVSTGDGHTCAITGAGALYCWGSNAFGKLGVGDTVTRNTPTQVGTDSDWRLVSAGAGHTCAIKTNGRLYCWGHNDRAQLGTSATDTADHVSPEPVGSDLWEWVSAGASSTQGHTCAIRIDGRMWCFGANNTSQSWRTATGILYYGPGTELETSAGTRHTDWVRVDAANQSTCGIRDDDVTEQTWCWGTNGAGQGGKGNSSTAPGATIDGFGDWRDVSIVSATTCGLREDGRAYCWGSNGSGVFGDGTSGQTTNAPAAGPAGNWASIAVGFSSACGLALDGSLRCWGNNIKGVLGLGGPSSQVPNQEASSATDWSDIAAWSSGACGLRGGALYCWGIIPVPDPLNPSAPQRAQVPTRIGTASDWTAIVAGGTHLCGIRNEASGTENNLYCWSTSNTGGELGVGDNNPRIEPAREATAATNWTAVVAGDGHTLGLRGGALWGWGKNFFGQLALGAGDLADKSTPVASIPVSPPSDWLALSAGLELSCGIRDEAATNTLYCWGNQAQGRLGIGTGTLGGTVPDPTLVSAGWQAVATGNEHACAISTAGTLSCWGRDHLGQLGLPLTSTSFDTPQAVGASSGWTDISAMGNTSCGIEAGTAYCWGAGTDGQTGTGSGYNRDVPTAISGGGTWTQISVGNMVTCGLKDEGGGSRSAWCWGANTLGQLGNNTAWRLTPAAIAPP